MKPLIFVANWKSNKTSTEALSWWETFSAGYQPTSHTIILAVSDQLLPILAPLVAQRQDIRLAAQDVSPFTEGAHTGAIAAEQLKEFAQAVLIGHSEIRAQTGETVEQRKEKITQVSAQGLMPCVFYNGPDDSLLPAPYLVYEPPTAISPHPAETPEDVDRVTQAMHQSAPAAKLLYGGSVTADNVRSFVSLPLVDGVVVGHASLDPEEFMEVIKHA